MNTLVAITPSDLAPAQFQLTEFIGARIVGLNAEFNEVEVALESARRNKWGTKALTNVLNKLQRRRTFYGKLQAAVDAGYVIMPALPMDVIAIRTKAKGPRQAQSDWSSSEFVQHAQALPSGEGEYQNPVPIKDSFGDTDAKGKEVTKYFPVDWRDDLEMPVELCKPELLERTQQAMALKLFDEIGVVRDDHGWNRRGDPMIVGTIIDPTRQGRRLAFFLAWALPLDAL